MKICAKTLRTCWSHRSGRFRGRRRGCHTPASLPPPSQSFLMFRLRMNISIHFTIISNICTIHFDQVWASFSISFLRRLGKVNQFNNSLTRLNIEEFCVKYLLWDFWLSIFITINSKRWCTSQKFKCENTKTPPIDRLFQIQYILKHDLYNKNLQNHVQHLHLSLLLVPYIQ